MRRTIRKACTGTKNILVIAAAVFAVCVHSSGYTQAADGVAGNRRKKVLFF